MLARMDRNSEVQGAVPTLAHMCRMSVEQFRDCIKTFEDADPDTQTPDDEGKRLIKIDGGWKIVNGMKWREKFSTQARQLRQAQWKREKKQRAKDGMLSKKMKQHLAATADIQLTMDQEAERKSKEGGKEVGF